MRVHRIAPTVALFDALSHRHRIETMTKAYNAYSKHGSRSSPVSPRAAAQAFFSAFPKARKCDVCEGELSGDGFFTLKLSLLATSKARQWKDVTPRTVADLPDTSDEAVTNAGATNV